MIKENHYTKSIPSGKSHYFSIDGAIVCFAMPANKNIKGFLVGGIEGDVWELSRLWAPDGHEKNLLTRAMSVSIKRLKQIEPGIIALVSYADPNAGHEGGVYRAASWVYCGRSEETRAYVSEDGQIVSRRAFHSGGNHLTKAGIEARGFREFKSEGKQRFAKGLTRLARKRIAIRRCEDV